MEPPARAGRPRGPASDGCVGRAKRPRGRTDGQGLATLAPTLAHRTHRRLTYGRRSRRRRDDPSSDPLTRRRAAGPGARSGDRFRSRTTRLEGRPGSKRGSRVEISRPMGARIARHGNDLRPVLSAILVLCMLLGGCRTFNVQTDWDPEARFERLQRFQFVEPPAVEGADPFADNSLLRK